MAKAGLFGSTSKSLFGTAKKSPLDQVLSGNVKKRADLSAIGASDPTAKPSPSALERIFGVMDIPGVAVRGLVHNAIDSKKPVDISSEVGKSWRGERRVEGADILGDLGVQNKWGKLAGGLALDILLDPVTYITMGIGGAGKSATTSALGKMAAVNADDFAREGIEALVKAGITKPGMAEKLAPLYAKYGDDFAKGLKNVPDTIYDDVARVLGYKEGIKFMGQRVIPASTNKGARWAKNLMRGKNARVPQGINDVLDPLSRTLEKAFIYPDAADTLHQAGEAERAFELMRITQKNNAKHVADTANRAFAKHIEKTLPNERTRAILSMGISKQLGGPEDIAAIAKELDVISNGWDTIKAANKLADKDAAAKIIESAKDRIATASLERSKLIEASWNPNAVRETLEAGGVAGDELETAVKLGDEIQAYLDKLLDLRKGAGLKDTTLFGVSKEESDLLGIPRSAAYVRGGDVVPRQSNRTLLHPFRGEAAETRKASGMFDEILNATEPAQVSGRYTGFGSRKQVPSAEKSKSMLTPEMRRAGLTKGDLLAGVDPTGKPLSTELDPAKWVLSRAQKDSGDIVYKQYVDDITRVLGDDPDLIKDLEKGREFFTNDEATKGFLRQSDKILNTWRKWATIYNFPMFPARNSISNKYLLATEGILSPAAQNHAIQIAMNPALNKSFTHGGVTRTAKEWLDEAAKRRVWVGEFEKMELVGGGKSSKLGEVLGDVNQRFVEDSDRLAGWFAALDKGLDEDAAALLVDRALYSYAPEARTVFERNVMRRITPFYTFMRSNTPHMATLLTEKPGALTWVGHAKESGEAATGIDESVLPDYMKNLFPIPVPGLIDQNKTTMLSTSGILPIADLERTAPFQSPKEMVRENLSALNPFVRDLFIEFPLNIDIYRQGPIERFSGDLKRMPSYIEVFDDNVKGLPVIDPVWAKVKDALGIFERTSASGDAYLAGNAYAIKAVQDFVPWMSSVARVTKEDRSGLITQLSGVKMSPYEPENFAQQKAYDDQAALSDELLRLKQEGKTPKKKATVKGLFGGK
jgi:hypothetical protein